MSSVVPPGITYARSKFGVAVKILDGLEGRLKERLEEASKRILTLTLDELPPLLAADYVSLQHRLTWMGAPIPGGPSPDTIRLMAEEDAEDAARLIRELYVNLLAIAPARDEPSRCLEK